MENTTDFNIDKTKNIHMISYRIKCKNGEKTIPSDLNLSLNFSIFIKTLVEDYSKIDDKNVVIFEINYLTIEQVDLFITFLNSLKFIDMNNGDYLYRDLILFSENLENNKLLSEQKKIELFDSLFSIQPNLRIFYNDVLSLNNILEFHELSDYLRIPILEYLVINFLINSLNKEMSIKDEKDKKLESSEYIDQYFVKIQNKIENLSDEDIEVILKSN